MDAERGDSTLPATAAGWRSRRHIDALKLAASRLAVRVIESVQLLRATAKLNCGKLPDQLPILP
jgi:hypothetical protein